MLLAILLILSLLGETLAVLAIPNKRQNPTTTTMMITTTTSVPTTTGGQNDGNGDVDGQGDNAVSISVVIPIACALGGILFVAFIFSIRNKLKFLFTFPRSLHTRSTSLDSTNEPLTGLTAEELATSRRRTGTGASTGSSDTGATRGTGSGGTGGNTTAQGTGTNGTRIETREPTVRTLPVYRKEAGDDELILVRQRSNSDISEVDIEFEDPDPNPNPTAPLTPPILPLAPPATHTLRPLYPPDQLPDVTPPTVVNDDPPTPPHSAPPGHTQLTRIPSSTRSQWGEAPSYFDAITSPFLSSSTTEQGLSTSNNNGIIPGPRSATSETFRNATSGFSRLLSRAGFAPGSFRPNTNGRPMEQRHSSHTSMTSLLLQPQTSRLSTTSNRATSPFPSPEASTHSLLISSPIPNTAMRASFIDSALPRAGLSEDQMRFLSSAEAVNLAGVRLDEPPRTPRRVRRASAGAGNDALLGDASPGTPSLSQEVDQTVEAREGAQAQRGDLPSWEQVVNETRRTQAAERQGLARPVVRHDNQGDINPSQPHGAGEGAEVVETLRQDNRVVRGVDLTGGEGQVEQDQEGMRKQRQEGTDGRSPPGRTRQLSITVPSRVLLRSNDAPVLEVEPPTPLSAVVGLER
ncbi:hypothetical protein TREMEDRAFT_59732 [Tremella mesenterica DSM 1558]|uniref:uncharacterized protein n=1 Tax=Tremella mesenterica (strain ATCC 24925 / CBS 8224 / DSM 1558 / NBRC 9311 / NRRL Y-6157 / RJB 2259-6 / UBC 559-6) TaxID=578456 RepID=UPI0003F48D40|nr:uncharacterized protein TREMEDRAFT_59732 [Tremella mesenterica DSM 1558]EIW73554.1 hypothetical protein TREMEDRAFT_59732 [Tremella mesenterica DSM 1558]